MDLRETILHTGIHSFLWKNDSRKEKCSTIALARVAVKDDIQSSFDHKDSRGTPHNKNIFLQSFDND